MEADEYERRYMNLDGPVRFRDRPGSRRLAAEVGGVALLLAAILAFGLGWPLLALLALAGGAGLLLGVTMSSYRVVLTDKSLHVQFGLRSQRISLTAIEEVTVARHAVSPTLAGREPSPSLDARFGAAAQRYGAIQSAVAGLPAPPLQETVRVRWRQGQRAKTTIIGTERASELADVLSDARARVTAPPARTGRRSEGPADRRAR